MKFTKIESIDELKVGMQIRNNVSTIIAKIIAKCEGAVMTNMTANYHNQWLTIEQLVDYSIVEHESDVWVPIEQEMVWYIDFSDKDIARAKRFTEWDLRDIELLERKLLFKTYEEAIICANKILSDVKSNFAKPISEHINMVYVVTSGTYSEYRIESIFTEKHFAEAYINSFGEDPCAEMTIEEWELHNGNYNGYIKDGRALYFIRFQPNFSSDIRDIEKAFQHDTSEDIKKGKKSIEISLVHDNCIHMRIWARDKDHAIKIAGDERAKYLSTLPEFN